MSKKYYNEYKFIDVNNRPENLHQLHQVFKQSPIPATNGNFTQIIRGLFDVEQSFFFTSYYYISELLLAGVFNSSFTQALAISIAL